VFGFLKVEYNGSIPPSGVAKSMKEKLKSFNMVFDDLCRVQSSWFIFDEQLKEEIRISIEKLLLPAYENFIGRFHNIVDVGKHAEKYIKYETEEIEERLSDLFQGSSGSTGSRKRS
jgi:archaellum biogenesis protein FlaJ (TadC family)